VDTFGSSLLASITAAPTSPFIIIWVSGEISSLASYSLKSIRLFLSFSMSIVDGD